MSFELKVEHDGQQIRVDFKVLSWGRSARVSGPPDSWAPAEPGELEIQKVVALESGEELEDADDLYDKILDDHWDDLWDAAVEQSERPDDV